jgi:hypothetical protein
MKDRDLIRRLPYHAEPKVVPRFQLNRLLGSGMALAVVTNGETGVNLWPGPKHPVWRNME